MYTFLITKNNELVASQKERIMQRSKLVDTLRFYVDQYYNGVDMSDFTATLEYITPVSREYKVIYLEKSDELYKDKLEYAVPFDTSLTKEAGNIDIQVTFTKVTIDENNLSTQQVRKTTPAQITIVPISAWSDIIPDSALTALDQKLIQINAAVEAASAVGESIIDALDTKADNIVYNATDKSIQLTANGTAIGNKVMLGNIRTTVESIEVNDDDEMVIHYTNGTEQNVGRIGGDPCAGVYIPSFNESGTVMKFTLSDTPGNASYEFDLSEEDNWQELPTGEVVSRFHWDQL